MSVKIRLTRVGKKKTPTYRVIVTDSRNSRDGSFIEILGNYDPHHEENVVNIDGDKALEWLLKGAQPTETTARVLVQAGVWDRFEQAKGRKIPLRKGA